MTNSINLEIPADHGPSHPIDQNETTSPQQDAGHVLIVDDDEGTCELIELGLRKRGFRVMWRTSPTEALELARNEDFDVVVTDLRMDEMSGLELCQRMAATRPSVPVVMVTGRGGVEAVVSAMRVGIYDYITKPLDMKLLTVAIRRAIDHRRLQQEVHRLRQVVCSRDRGGTIIGESYPIRELRDLIARVAVSDASVLIAGESGTGKELVARELHDRSDRRDGPFVAINCAAVPAQLLESELFGHLRGAFTDARSARPGLFVEANGGTLFLDEVGELPMEMQPKLLRALQERSVRPVGGTREISFDARIVTSTNRDLLQEVDASRFRQDLFYRLNVVRIEVPPLRERGRDILLLAQHFLRRFAESSGKKVEGIAALAASRLLTYRWPGNVRELENCIERAVTLTVFDQVVLDDLPETVLNHGEGPAPTPEHIDELVPLHEVERRYIQRVLRLVDGNKSRAAEILGVDRRTLYRKLERQQTKRVGSKM